MIFLGLTFLALFLFGKISEYGHGGKLSLPVELGLSFVVVFLIPIGFFIEFILWDFIFSGCTFLFLE